MVREGGVGSGEGVGVGLRGGGGGGGRMKDGNGEGGVYTCTRYILFLRPCGGEDVGSIMI